MPQTQTSSNPIDQFLASQKSPDAFAPPPPSTSPNPIDQFLGTPNLKPMPATNPVDEHVSGLTAGTVEPSTPESGDGGGVLGKAWDWINKPLVTLPEAEDTGMFGKAAPVVRGVEHVAEGLLTPMNIGLMVATGGLGGLAEGGIAAAEGTEALIGSTMATRGGAAAFRTLAEKYGPQTAEKVFQTAKWAARAANLGFTGQQIKGVAEAVPGVQDRLRVLSDPKATPQEKEQASSEALQLGTEALLGATIAGLGAYHGVRELTGKGNLPAWTQNQEALAAYQQPAKSYGVKSYQFEKANQELVRNRPMDMAALLYHEAGADTETLKQWQTEVEADKAIKPAIREKWSLLLQQAQNLPENVKQLSAQLRGSYDEYYDRLVAMGKLLPEKVDPETGEKIGVKRENYAGQHEYFQGDEGESDLRDVRARSTKTPGFVKRRTYDNVIDALHNGWEQKTGLAASHSAYLRRFGEMEGLMAAEKKMMGLKAPDGRPMAVSPAATRDVRGNKTVPLPADFEVTGARLGRLGDEPVGGPAWDRSSGEPDEAMARRSKVPTPEELKKKEGTTKDLKNANWITEDGDIIPRNGIEHDIQLGGKLTDNYRELFIQHGKAIRVLWRRGLGGDELAVTIPNDGPTYKQLDQLRKTESIMPYGNMYIETVADNGDKPRAQYIENPTAAKIEGAVRRMTGIRDMDEAMARRRPEASGYVENKFSAMLPDILNAHNTTGGSTFNIEGGNLAGKDAYAVSIFPERTLALDHAPTQEDIAGYIRKNADLLHDPRVSFSSWNDPATGKHIFDISATTPNRAEAIALGKKYDQNSIAYLKDFSNTPTGGSGGAAFTGSTPAEQRLAELSHPYGSVNTVDRSTLVNIANERHLIPENLPGSEHSKPALTYSEATKTGTNPWVRRSADARGTAQTDNSARTLLVQFSSDLLHTANEAANEGEQYYNKLYSGTREGFGRPEDFWEIPKWISDAAYMLPHSDVYVVRDVAQARDFFNKAGYKNLAFSALDVNKKLILDLAKDYKGHIDVGGYTDPAAFKELPNVKWHDSMESVAKESGVSYKQGSDYRHFEGTSEVIPRLTMSDGCLHRCAFCAVPQKLDVTPAHLVDQQVEAISKLGSKLVYLNDKTFGQAKNYQDLSDIYTKMKQRNPNFKGFVVQTTAAQMQKMPAEWLAKSGIKFVELGIESYNDPLLKAMHKPATEDLINKATDRLRQAKIALIPNILVGYPGETAETYAHTMNWLKDNQDIISHANIYNIAVYDNTELGKQVTTASPSDFNENVLEKSFHTEPEVHRKFAGELYGLAEEMLNGTPRALKLERDLAHAGDGLTSISSADDGVMARRKNSPSSGKDEAVARRGSPAGSTVPLLKKPLPIEERPTVQKVAKALNDFTTDKSQLNALDLASSNPEEMVGRAREIGAHELYKQLGAENSGKGWYAGDVDRFHRAMSQIHPELADDKTAQTWYNALTAAASLGNDSPSTIKNADEIYTEWKKTGKVPVTRPDGSDWGGEHSNANRAVLENLQKIVDHNDGDWRKATDWLLTKHPVLELNEVRARATKLPGKATDMQYGSRALSAKAGPFHLNLSGIPDEFTMDKWATRTWNRWMGTLVNPDGSVNEAPTPAQRRVAKLAFEELGKKFKLETREAQAVMWFYEQKLYAEHGVNIDQGVSYGDAAEDYARRKLQPGGDAENSGAAEGAGSSAESGRVRSADGSAAGQVPSDDVSFNPEDFATRRGEVTPREAGGIASTLSNPAETGNLRVLDLNHAGIKALGKIMGWPGDSVDGLNEGSRRVLAAADAIEQSTTDGPLRELAQNLRAAAEHNGHAGVIIRRTGLSPEEAGKALDEELWHSGQRAAGLGRWTVHTDEVTKRLAENPLEQKVSATLQQAGYPDHPRTIALEAEAKILAQDYAGVGLSYEEAQQLIFDHVRALEEVHPDGIPTPNEHAQRYAAAMKKVAEAHAERIKQVQETELPRPEAGGQVGEHAQPSREEAIGRRTPAEDQGAPAPAAGDTAGVAPWGPDNMMPWPGMLARRGDRRGPAAPGESPSNGQPEQPKIHSDKGKLYLDVSDYKPGPDVFARHRRIATDQNGDPVYQRANLLIHPDHAEEVNKMFADSSWFRKNPVTHTLLKISTEGKKSLLSFSPFHWTTEYLRGIQMGLSPLEAMHPKELTPDRLAVTSKFGPTLMDTKSRSLFNEGAGQHSELVNKIPYFGKIMTAAENKLFGDYIPRLKADAFDKVVGQLSGRHPNWTEDQIHFAASKIVDSAFGGLNWKMMGVSANSQDALRMVMLAPDFTGSQVLFAKYGAQPGGSVVHSSLARIAAYNFLVARALNMLVSGKLHLEHPFAVSSPDDKKTFSIRTMPEDIFHGLTDPRGFLYNRLNPVLARTGWEALSGRDQRGKAVDTQQQIHDLIKNVMPIPAQNLVPSFRNPTDTVGQGVMRGLGIASQPNMTVAQKAAAQLASNHAESGPVDKAKLEHHQRVIQLEDAIRSGQVPMTALSEAVLSGQLAVKDAKAVKENIARTKGMDDNTARLFTRAARLPMSEFLDGVWAVATPPEKTALLPLLMKKRAAYFKQAMTELTPQQRLKDPTIQKLMKMFPQEAVF